MICIDTTLLTIILAPIIVGAIYYWKGNNDTTKWRTLWSNRQKQNRTIRTTEIKLLGR